MFVACFINVLLCCRHCTPYTSLEPSPDRKHIYLLEVNGTEKAILQPWVALSDCRMKPSAKDGFALLYSAKDPKWRLEIPHESCDRIAQLQKKESTKQTLAGHRQQLETVDAKREALPNRARHYRPRMTFSEV